MKTRKERFNSAREINSIKKHWEAEFIENRIDEVLSMTKEQREQEIKKNMEKYKQKYGYYPDISEKTFVKKYTEQ